MQVLAAPGDPYGGFGICPSVIDQMDLVDLLFWWNTHGLFRQALIDKQGDS